MERPIYIKRHEIEREEKWDDFIATMPFINLKDGYQFRVFPPFGGAMFRFKIKAPSRNEYSIYFDAYGALGCYGKPYYELYPFDDDVFRSESIDDVIEMIYKQESSK